VPAVREWVVQCHGVVADHAAQCRTAAGSRRSSAGA
jgi:hypothetical protein